MSHTTTEHSGRLNSIKETAERLGCGRSTVYSLIGAGKLRAVKLGKLARVSDAEIERLIASLPEAEIGGCVAEDRAA